MRYRLQAEIEGNLEIEADVVTEFDGLRVELKSDEKGRLSTVVVSTKVQPERVSLVASAVTLRARNRDAARPPLDEEQQLTRYLQSLESDLAYSSAGHIDRIRWDDAFESAKPESDEENKLVPEIYGRFTIGRPQLQFPITIDAAKTILELSPRDDDLVLTKAFWREGENEYRQVRYVQAFYNFFFVIEGLFAEGQSSKHGVLKAFRESSEMNAVTQLVLNRARLAEGHWLRLQELFKSNRCNEDTPGAQKLLFLLRGRLHHFSTKNRRLQGTPLTQSQFETAARFARDFAFVAIARKDGKALYPQDRQWKSLLDNA